MIIFLEPPKLLEVHWDDGNEWSSRKPGIQLQPLPDGPAPAGTKPGSVRQMKDQCRRFSITLIHPDWGREQLRSLPRPIHRYADPDSGLQDGAIFSFACSGTNPAALLVIELHDSKDSPGTWHFGCAGMTNAALVARCDENEVWKAPYVPNPSKLDTWLWFGEDVGRRPK